MEHASPQRASGAPLRSFEFSQNLAAFQEGVIMSRLMNGVKVQSALRWSLLHEVAHVFNGMSPTRA